MTKIYIPNVDKPAEGTPNENHFFIIKINPELDAIARVSPIFKCDYDNDDNMIVTSEFIGYIEFKDEDNFRAGYIAHEALHCATTFIRLFGSHSLELNPEDIDDDEEYFANIVEYFAREITNYYWDIVKKGEYNSIFE